MYNDCNELKLKRSLCVNRMVFHPSELKFLHDDNIGEIKDQVLLAGFHSVAEQNL